MAYVASLDPENWDYGPHAPGQPKRAAAAESGTIELGNEFAFVRVRKVLTRNGERLEIEAPKTGRTIRLDPVELESLTWQDPSTFSSFLETPYGPEPGSER
jgi:hypothetical protein